MPTVTLTNIKLTLTNPKLTPNPNNANKTPRHNTDIMASYEQLSPMTLH